MNNVRFDLLVEAEAIQGEDPEETRLLQETFEEASKYLKKMKWCQGIKKGYFGIGIGGVFGVFLFNIEAAPNIDEWLWVISGDLPSAYLVTDEARDPVNALKVYCDLMDGWIKKVRGKEAGPVFPVEAEPTVQNSKMLEKRVRLLREKIIPAYTED
jgi:hypothetical protein